MKRFLARLLLLVSAPLILSHCANTDPGFSPLAAQANPDPARDAITGMWHKREFTVEWVERPRCSLLFRPEGTGLYRFATGSEVLAQDRLMWSYAGGGVWSLQWLERGEFSPLSGRAQCRLTKNGNTLLWTGLGTNWVFDRVE